MFSSFVNLHEVAFSTVTRLNIAILEPNPCSIESKPLYKLAVKFFVEKKMKIIAVDCLDI